MQIELGDYTLHRMFDLKQFTPNGVRNRKEQETASVRQIFLGSHSSWLLTQELAFDSALFNHSSDSFHQKIICGILHLISEWANQRSSR